MTREEIIKLFQSLAMSQGYYGRLLKHLKELEERDPEAYDEFMSELESECSDPLDVVMAMEG